MWKFLEVPAVQGGIAGAVVTLIGTFLNNFINVKNTDKIIKSNKENIENTMKHNKENIEKEHNFRKNQEEKNKLKEILESILGEIVADNSILQGIFSELEVLKNKDERFITSYESENVHKQIKLKYNYNQKFDKALLLSLMYFRELHTFISEYKNKTNNIYTFFISDRVSKSSLEDIFKDEYDPYEDYRFKNIIFSGRRALYQKIIEKITEEIKKLSED